MSGQKHACKLPLASCSLRHPLPLQAKCIRVEARCSKLCAIIKRFSSCLCDCICGFNSASCLVVVVLVLQAR